MGTKLAYFLFSLLTLMFPAFSSEKENNEETFLQTNEQEKQDSQQQEKHVKFVEEKLNPLEKRHNFSKGVQVLQRTLQKRGQSAMETFDASSPHDDLLLKSKRKNQNKVHNIVPFLIIDNFDEQNKSEGQGLQAREERIQEEQEKFSVADKNIHPNVGNIHQREKEKEMKMVEKQLSKVKDDKRLNLYPNDSSVKMFRDMKTDEIAWEDPKNLIRTAIKEDIEFSLKQKGEEMSNFLFECFSNWIAIDVPEEANPFLKALMLPMAENVDIMKRDKFNQTPLMFCATFDAKEAVVKLIERCAKMDATDEVGWSALHFAAQNGSELSCKVLLEQNANVNAITELGKTPLMFAAKNGHVGVVTQLLEGGADTKMEDKSCLTASYYAKRKCRKVIREYDAK